MTSLSPRAALERWRQWAADNQECDEVTKISQQTLIAVYGEVLTLVEIVEMLTEAVREHAAREDVAPIAATLYTVAQQHREIARRSQGRAIDVLLEKFPRMELDPLTGDVLDPPQA